MAEKTSLKELERKLYQASLKDGILDIQIGCVLLIFAVAPLLSVYLGDFWSSAVFLPFWALVFLGSRLVKNKIIYPRIGRIEYGTYRVKRLKHINIVILIFNLVAFGLGIFAFFGFQKFPAWIPLSILFLVGFSLFGYLVESPRFYVYGVMTALGPLVGEYLYQNQGFSHHGFPLVFGLLATSLIVGLRNCSLRDGMITLRTGIDSPR